MTLLWIDRADKIPGLETATVGDLTLCRARVREGAWIVCALGPDYSIVRGFPRGGK
jgi:hypothetical protein